MFLINLYLISVLSAILSMILLFNKISKLVGMSIKELINFSQIQKESLILMLVPIINLILVFNTLHDILFLSDEEFENKYIQIK